MKRFSSIACCIILISGLTLPLFGCNQKAEDETIYLNVGNWEEYMDQGDWDEEYAVVLEDGTTICPKNSLVEDFEQWYYENYGKKVQVNYSTFGTNEELYNQITLGDEFDLVCPSEYMIMKLMSNNMLQPFTEDFYDTSVDTNYYAKGVSNYISRVFNNLTINNEKMYNYAAGYMWGTLGIVYNSEAISEEEASNWNLLLNEDYFKKVTIKDSVRDAYFAANNIYQQDRLTELIAKKASTNEISAVINDTSVETVNNVANILEQTKKNVYAFETDSGKADLATGKILACMQWSGDAVYTMDQVGEDAALKYVVPEGAGNLWFDGWCMLKDSVYGNSEKQQAAEAFVNFLSRPDNAVRNMEYIGYSSVIAGSDDTIYQYVDSNYGMTDEDLEEGEELAEYSLDYFFNDKSGKHTITTSDTYADGILTAVYPTEDVISRCCVMAYFNDADNKRINQKWIDIRCFAYKNIFK